MVHRRIFFLRLAMLPGLDIGELKQQSISFSAFNILLSITGILGNCLILVALRKESSLHPPSKLLYRCLATTDPLVGLVNHPFYTTYVVGVEIQRDCNFKAHIYYFSYRLGCMSSGWFIISSQVPCWPFVQLYGYTILPSNLNHLVRKDFSRSQSSSGSNTRSCSTTTKPTKYTEHSAIQKGTVQCTVGTISFSCLLCTTSYSGICDLFQ